VTRFESLYTAEEMRAAEAGHDVATLMERAGKAVGVAAVEGFFWARAFTVVCGGGANGGDGRIAAAVIAGEGRDVRVVDAKAGERELGSPEVIVDALFGTGFRGEPRPDAAALIEAMNGSGAEILAVDLPSGVDADSGEVAGAAVRANATVTMHGRKVGLEVAPGRFHAGAVFVADIGLEPRETEAKRVRWDILREVPRRRPWDNKYRAGSVLVVGGSRGMTGAVSLAAEAAFRADAGYVAVCVPEESLPVVEMRLLEAVKRRLEDVDDAATRASAIALGPGLGRDRKDLVRRLLRELEKPVVVDADALHELEPGDWPAPRVLTPHAGELARLLGRESGWVDTHRVAAVREAAERFGCVVLLKGADTLIAAPGEGLLVASGGLPSLATAGTGDVLTGIVAAFLAKGMEPRLAAAAAAAAHAKASVEAPFRAGLVASDVIAALPRVFG
jgi:NAD(P)H-hydrate epimerase